MCDCIKEIDTKLKEQGRNTQICVAFGMSGTINQTMVLTVKADDTKREKPVKIFAAYCPFCGEKYPQT